MKAANSERTRPRQFGSLCRGFYPGKPRHERKKYLKTSQTTVRSCLRCGVWRWAILSCSRPGEIKSVGRIGASAITALENLPIEFDSETDLHAWNATFHFASRHRLTLYDASYLELAHRLRLPLATLDKELRTAGKNSGFSYSAFERHIFLYELITACPSAPERLSQSAVS